MDKEQARFLLDTWLPGQDPSDDPNLMAALAEAGQDPALARWLADTRALDAALGEALRSTQAPADLPSRIRDAMALRRADFPECADEEDARIALAIATIRTPPSLRSRLLVASARSARQSRRSRLWRKFALPFAAAAGITMALLGQHSEPVAAKHSPLPLDVVQASFIRAYQSPLFTLDERQENQKVLLDVLESKGLPCPCCLPPGLQNGRGIGCREFLVDGHRGAVVCFDDQDNGTVHLVIFRTEDVCGSLPEMDQPAFCRQGPWTVARWQHADKIYFLIGSTDEQRLAKLF